MIDRIILFCLKNKLLINVLLVLTTFVILFFTMMPQNQLGESTLYDYDKLGHFLIFFSWTLLYGIFTFNRRRTETKLILVFFAGAAFGIGIEILQGILPIGRTMDIYDAYSDIFASLLAIVCLFWIKRLYLSSEMEKQLKKI